MNHTVETPALILRGAAAERSTRVTRMRAESRRNKPWLRVQAFVFVLLGACALGFVGLVFVSHLIPDSLYQQLGLTTAAIFGSMILAAVLVSAILTNRGPGWIPRVGLAFTGAHAIWQVGQALAPATGGRLGEALGALLATAAIALTLASEVSRFKLPRHLRWIRALAWLLIAIGAITLAQAPAELGWRTSWWFITLAAGLAWSAAYVSIVSALRAAWFDWVLKVNPPGPVGLSASLVIFALTWPTLAVLGAWIESPTSEGLEGAPLANAPWSPDDILLATALLLGTAYACMWLFSYADIAAKSSSPKRPAHPAGKAE